MMYQLIVCSIADYYYYTEEKKEMDKKEREKKDDLLFTLYITMFCGIL